VNQEAQMSIDTAAESTPARGEKDVVRSLTSVSRPDQTTVGSAMDKLARMGEAAQPRANVPPVVADQIKTDIAADKPVLQVSKPETTVRFPVTLPDDLVFHCVQPYELDSLTHLARPVSLAVASIATGCALGMIPLVHGAIDAVGDLSKINNVAMLWYLIYAMIFALTSGIALIAWINAIRGRRDARRLLRDIRQRPNIPLSLIVKQ
jgi:hypothetical protein